MAKVSQRMHVEERDELWDSYCKLRQTQADRASHRGFSKLMPMQVECLKMLERGTEEGEPYMKAHWKQELALAKKDPSWVTESISKPVGLSKSVPTKVSGKVVRRTVSLKSLPRKTFQTFLKPYKTKSSRKSSSKLQASSQALLESFERDTHSMVSDSTVSDPTDLENTFVDVDPQREGLEKDPFKNLINEKLVNLAQEHSLDAHDSIVVLDAPKSRLSSKALSKAGFDAIEVPNCFITADRAKTLSKNGTRWFASQAFDHLKSMPAKYRLIYLDFCGHLVKHVKDLMMALERFDWSKGPCIFGVTFQVTRVVSDAKGCWSELQPRILRQMFEAHDLKIESSHDWLQRHNSMMTHVWVLSKA